MPLLYVPSPLWYSDYYYPSVSDTVVDGSTHEEFRLNFDVQGFDPKKVTVTVDNSRNIRVEAKQEEKQDKDGSIVSKSLTGVYYLPDQYDVNKIKSCLYKDGILIITAPRIEGSSRSKDQRNVNIQKVAENYSQKRKTEKRRNSAIFKSKL